MGGGGDTQHPLSLFIVLTVVRHECLFGIHGVKKLQYIFDIIDEYVEVLQRIGGKHEFKAYNEN